MMTAAEARALMLKHRIGPMDILNRKVPFRATELTRHLNAKHDKPLSMYIERAIRELSGEHREASGPEDIDG